jgi:hypothetical protein
MLLLLPCALLCLVLLWKRPGWRAALGLGLSEFLLLYAYPGAFYVLVFANLAFLSAVALRAWRGIETPWPAARRWLIGSLAGAMCFLQLYAPCIPQLQLYMKSDRAQAGEMDLAWLKDFGGLGLAGTRWSFPDPANSVVVTLTDILERRHFLWAVLAIFAFALVVGLIRLARAGGLATGYALAFATSILFTFIHATLINNFLYHWYLIFALPLLIVFMALGIEQFGGWFIRRSWRPTGYVAPALLIVLYAILTSPQRHVLRTKPVEPQRESVLETRPELGLTHAVTDPILTFGFAMGGSHLMTVPSYDPAASYVSSEADLRELMIRADAEQKPLFANIAMPALARLAYSEPMSILDDQNVFSLVNIFYGLEDNVTRYIYRYNPGSIQAHEAPTHVPLPVETLPGPAPAPPPGVH